MKDIKQILQALKIPITANDGFANMVVLPNDESYFLEHIAEDLNAIRELEMLVIDKFGANEYGLYLANTVGGFSILGKSMAQIAIFATADGTTRITAMLTTIEESK